MKSAIAFIERMLIIAAWLLTVREIRLIEEKLSAVPPSPWGAAVIRTLPDGRCSFVVWKNVNTGRIAKKDDCAVPTGEGVVGEVLSDGRVVGQVAP